MMNASYAEASCSGDPPREPVRPFPGEEVGGGRGSTRPYGSSARRDCKATKGLPEEVAAASSVSSVRAYTSIPACACGPARTVSRAYDDEKFARTSFGAPRAGAERPPRRGHGDRRQEAPRPVRPGLVARRPQAVVPRHAIARHVQPHPPELFGGRRSRSRGPYVASAAHRCGTRRPRYLCRGDCGAGARLHQGSRLASGSGTGSAAVPSPVCADVRSCDRGARVRRNAEAHRGRC